MADPKPTGASTRMPTPKPTSPVKGAFALPGPGGMSSPLSRHPHYPGAGNAPFNGLPNLWEDAPEFQPSFFKDEIRAYWAERAVIPAAAWKTAGFVTGTPQDVVAQFLWYSPVFDLRKDLHQSYGEGVPEAVPIGRAGSYGGGVRLTVLGRIAGGAIPDYAQDLRVYAQELVHPTSSRDMQQVSDWQDISTDWWAGNAATNLAWDPPGAPVRFWGVVLRFDQASGAAPDDTPTLSLDGNAQ